MTDPLLATRSELVPILKEVVNDLLMQQDLELVQDGTAPLWAVVTADAYSCTAPILGRDATWLTELLNRVKANIELQDAIVSGLRFGAKAFELIEAIESWETT